MTRRLALIIEAESETFRFYYDGDNPSELHITRRHGTTPEDAIGTFLRGSVEPWDSSRMRFASWTETHVLFWTRHAHDRSVIVISYVRRTDER
ncbi:MAG: hypothetical protein EPO26_06800 [Chloroflexota bacterium]|nr:MAG: hypothetical protein EPO26_06800 [Chloroflexota bacterium]